MIFSSASVLQNKVHTVEGRTELNGIFKLIMSIAQRQNMSDGHFTILIYYRHHYSPNPGSF